MKKYVCPCGYEYIPAQGDLETGVAPGTAWEDLPADWVCPVCGLGKEAFDEEEQKRNGLPFAVIFAPVGRE